MNYEKEYKWALERARKLYLYNGRERTVEVAIACATIFPELQESEDEKMFREIKMYIKEQGDKPTGLPNGTFSVSDMINWLEKLFFKFEKLSREKEIDTTDKDCDR